MTSKLFPNERYFPIIAPDGKKVYPIAPDGSEGRWRVGKQRMESIIENNLIDWGKKGNRWVAYEKVYYDGEMIKVIKERSILFDIANTGDASKELTDIFGKKDIFDNPKPVELIKFFILYTTGKNSIILDSYAGSGTTIHAVMDLKQRRRRQPQVHSCSNARIHRKRTEQKHLQRHCSRKG